MGKQPAFQSFEEFKAYCVANRKYGLSVLKNIGPYTPFIFQRPDKDLQICAGYFVAKELINALNPRRTGEYKAWRKSILVRDCYQCVRCGSRINLHVHHIKKLSQDVRVAVDLENGITLCASCHRKEHRALA